MCILRLHEAIVISLLRNKNRAMTYREIADFIKLNSLFIRPKDDQPPPPWQISARVNKYQQLFTISQNSNNMKVVRIYII